jgi:hypothetical protein
MKLKRFSMKNNITPKITESEDSRYSAKFNTNRYWELYFEGILIQTFSIKEIGGVYSDYPDVVRDICDAGFGKTIVSVARITMDSKQMLLFLNRIIQTQVESTTSTTRKN